MTYKERLKIEHPDSVFPGFNGGCKGCPEDYGYGPEQAYNAACHRHSNCYDCWNTECKDAEKTKTTFTKSDIKPGYVVQLRNDKFRMAIPVGEKGALVLTDETGDWAYLNSWDDNFNKKADPIDPRGLDIVAVYGLVRGTKNYDKAGRLMHDGRPTLWKRDETKKMTVSEISKALGYEVEIVAEKE